MKTATGFYLAAEDAGNPIIPVLEELVVGLIAFALLCFVLMKFVFPRMEQMYQQRVEAIEGGLQRAEQRQAEADRLLEQYKAQLAAARTEAAKIRDNARADAEGIRQDVLNQARAESERIIALGRETLTAERASLARALRGEIGALSVELASKIIGEVLADEVRRSGTVDRFLAELESPNGSAAPAGTR